MKSRVVGNPEIALALNVSGDVKNILSLNHIEIKEIFEEDMEDSVGHLAKIEGCEKLEGKSQKPETSFLVLSGLMGNRLNRILTRIGQQDKSILKAIVTSENCKWSFSKLFNEVFEEDKVINKKQ